MWPRRRRRRRRAATEPLSSQRRKAAPQRLADVTTLPWHPVSQESVVEKAKGALNNAKDAVR